MQLWADRLTAPRVGGYRGDAAGAGGYLSLLTPFQAGSGAASTTIPTTAHESVSVLVRGAHPETRGGSAGAARVLRVRLAGRAPRTGPVPDGRRSQRGATADLLWMEETWDTAYLWENARRRRSGSKPGPRPATKASRGSELLTRHRQHHTAPGFPDGRRGLEQPRDSAAPHGRRCTAPSNTPSRCSTTCTSSGRRSTTSSKPAIDHRPAWMTPPRSPSSPRCLDASNHTRRRSHQGHEERSAVLSLCPWCLRVLVVSFSPPRSLFSVSQPNILFIMTDQQRFDTIAAWEIHTFTPLTSTGWFGVESASPMHILLARCVCRLATSSAPAASRRSLAAS